MSSPDAEFLAEVEDFLLACDLPTFPLQALQEAENNEEMISALAVAPTQESVVDSVAPVSKPGKRLHDVDATEILKLARAKDRKRRSVYRERRRIEKENLNRQVEELSSRVDELQKTKNSEASAGWEKIAKRQLQARVNAEAEQRQLLSAVGSRSKLIGKLHSVVRNSVSTDTLGQVDPGEAAYQRKRIRLEASDVIFLKLEHNLNNFFSRNTG
ncbi:unnamed protein product [Phytophthora lilii]|uniref:Unnamed protein product n=1 Tax=Phytophthora lilii TaxID=2077276 RepID=A0A9W6THT2_9STRA|nr:unnamed protein product [Phytophthora lilii]